MRLFDRISEYRDRILAMDDRRRQVTYGDLERFSEVFYRYIGKRTLIFILCENTLECLLGYLGCLKMGVVPLMVNAGIHESLLGKLLREYRPEFVYAPAIRLKDKAEFPEVWKCGEYGLYCWTEGKEAALHKELALLLTTSGSTGSPKLVRQSRTNIDANTDSIVSYLNIDQEERPIMTLPMNYTYGLSIINSHVKAGALLLVTSGSVLERSFWEFAGREGATSFGGVPYTYQMLKRIGFLEMELPGLRTMTQAGGKLPVSLHELFAAYAARTGKRFVVMYGQTEATARMGYLPPGQAVRKCGSMGIAIPGGRFYLEDEAGRMIEEADTVGELVYQGANVCMGYAHKASDLAKGDEWHGVLKTGDMARRDSEGYYYITGRKKRFIKLFGNRVNLDEVERILKDGFKEADFACTGRDDLLQIFTDMGGKDAGERVCEYLYQITGMKGRAVRVYSILEIPKNTAGKTLYGELAVPQP